MGTYPGIDADNIILQGRIADWERAERDHARAPSVETDAARKALGKRVETWRRSMERKAKAARRDL